MTANDTTTKPTVISAAQFVSEDYAAKIAADECEVSYEDNSATIAKVFKDGDAYIAVCVPNPIMVAEGLIDPGTCEGYLDKTGDYKFTVRWLQPAASVRGGGQGAANDYAGMDDKTIKKLEKLARLSMGDDTNQDTEKEDVLRMFKEIKSLQAENAYLHHQLDESRTVSVSTDTINEREYEVIGNCLFLLGVTPPVSDWSHSIYGIQVAIKSNLEIGTFEMTKIDDWTDTELNKGSITEAMFNLLERAQKAEAALASAEARADVLREALKYYANKDLYLAVVTTYKTGEYDLDCSLLYEGGEIARKALEAPTTGGSGEAG